MEGQLSLWRRLCGDPATARGATIQLGVPYAYFRPERIDDTYVPSRCGHLKFYTYPHVLDRATTLHEGRLVVQASAGTMVICAARHIGNSFEEPQLVRAASYGLLLSAGVGPDESIQDVHYMCVLVNLVGYVQRTYLLPAAA